MHRIDHATAAPGNQFTEGNPATATPATKVTDDWLNDVQENICAVVEAAGIALIKGTTTQLRDAIQSMITGAQKAVVINGVTFEASVTNGKVVRWDSGNSRFDEAVADGTSNDRAVGVADVTNSKVYLFGECPIFAGLTLGARYYLDPTTPGAITTTAPTNAVMLGIAKSATTLWVDVDVSMATSVKQIQPITASVAGNALTITLNPTTLDFRSAALGSGTVNTRSISVPISMTVSSGSTLGTVNGQAARIALLAIDNAGTVELACVNLAGGNNLDETSLISSTAEGGAGAADSENVIYSTTVRTNVPFRVVGFIDSNQATAGVWATAPSKIQGFGGRALQTLPVQAAKAWVNFDGTLTGTITPRANFNISSVTKNASGDYTLNFSTPMNDANYSVGFSVKTGSQYDFVPKINNAATPTTTSCRVINANSTGATASAEDPSIFCVTIHGN